MCAAPHFHPTLRQETGSAEAQHSRGWEGLSRAHSPYPLFLAGHKGLEARCHTEAQLVDEWRLILAVDLHLDPSFK